MTTSFFGKFLSFLEQIKPEHNSKINLLTETLGLHNTTAYDSQSLLEWYDGYCTEKKCLDCIIGYHTLSNWRLFKLFQFDFIKFIVLNCLLLNFNEVY